MPRRTSRRREQATFRQRFEAGPTLSLPVGERFSFSFDPNAVAAFGEVGTIYRTAEIRDTWGRLTVTEGGVLLVQQDGRFVRVVVPAPQDLDGSPSTGDGWRLELAEGWELARGRRPGDRVARPVLP